jgi:hypothetical protein
VEEDDRRALALVEVREAQPLDLAVPGLEREIREPLEALLGGAVGVRHPAAAIARAVRRASAMIVSIGLVPEALGNALASPIHTPGVSWR